MDDTVNTGQVDQQPQEQQAPAVNMVPQDQVNKLVGREKANAYERGKREAEEKYQQQLDALRMGQEQRNANVSREVDANAIYQQVQERFNKEMQERQLKDHMTHVANNYLQKVAEGKKNYQDFDEVSLHHDATKFPQLTFLLSGIPNGGDVLYDLLKNPVKLSAMHTIAQCNPNQAQYELLKLSKSISDNRQAQADAQQNPVPEPLSQLSPSRVSGSGGKPSISDLRKQSYLRG